MMQMGRDVGTLRIAYNYVYMKILYYSCTGFVVLAFVQNNQQRTKNKQTLFL
jgi:hypothetical protein